MSTSGFNTDRQTGMVDSVLNNNFMYRLLLLGYSTYHDFKMGQSWEGMSGLPS